jgi:hypothetical protein
VPSWTFSIPYLKMVSTEFQSIPVKEREDMRREGGVDRLSEVIG